MDGFFTQVLRAIGVEPQVYKGSFAGNGTSSPASTSSRYPVGFNFSVTRSDTGTFSVTVPQGCTIPAQPHCIVLTPNPDSAGEWFEANVVGDSTLNASGRSFTVFTHRSGTARDPVGRVGFVIHFDNSTGR